MQSITEDSSSCNRDEKRPGPLLRPAGVQTNNHSLPILDGDLPLKTNNQYGFDGQYFDANFVAYVTFGSVFNHRNRKFVRFQEQEAILNSNELLLLGQQIEVLQFFKHHNGRDYVTKFRALPIHDKKEKFAMVVMGNCEKQPVLFTGSSEPFKYWNRDKFNHVFVPTFSELKKKKPSLERFFKVVSYEVRGVFKDSRFIESSSEKPMELFDVIGPITEEQRNLVTFYCLKKGVQPKTKMSYDDAEFLFSSFEKARSAAYCYLLHH